MRRVLHLAALALVVAGAGGCSQAAQLQPVAGGQVSAVRTATNDVLVTRQVDVGVAPVCEFADPYYECSGTTADGEAIESTAEVLAAYGETTDQWGAYVPADVSLVVTVAGAEIYSGKVEDVLLSNGQVAP